MSDLELRVEFLEQPLASFLWRIDDYTYHRDCAIENRYRYVESPFFYSYPFGYRMYCRIYLNGDGKKLSFFFFTFQQCDNSLSTDLYLSPCILLCVPLHFFISFYLHYFTQTGDGKHVGMFIFITRGAFDDILTWPFNKKIKVKILGYENVGTIKKSLDSGTDERRPSARRDVYMGMCQ